MYCIHCQETLQEDYSYCPYCGAMLADPKEDSIYQNKEIVISDRIAGILSYCTWIGWFVSFFTGNRKSKYVSFHLNQALILKIAALCLAGIYGIFNNTLFSNQVFKLLFAGAQVAILFYNVIYTVCLLYLIAVWGLALIAALQNKEWKIPIIGDIQILR